MIKWSQKMPITLKFSTGKTSMTWLSLSITDFWMVKLSIEIENEGNIEYYLILCSIIHVWTVRVWGVYKLRIVLVVSDSCLVDVDAPVLPDFIACHIPSSCTEIDCCISVDLVQRTFRSALHLDACNSVLHLQIEKFSWNISLLDYQWGIYRFLLCLKNLQVHVLYMETIVGF